MHVNVRKINHERLGSWEKRLNEYHSTPVIMVGVGHYEFKGRVFILTTEDRTDEETILFLSEALRQLEDIIAKYKEVGK